MLVNPSTNLDQWKKGDSIFKKVSSMQPSTPTSLSFIIVEKWGIYMSIFCQIKNAIVKWVYRWVPKETKNEVKQDKGKAFHTSKVKNDGRRFVKKVVKGACKFGHHLSLLKRPLNKLYYIRKDHKVKSYKVSNEIKITSPKDAKNKSTKGFMLLVNIGKIISITHDSNHNVGHDLNLIAS